MNNVGIEFTGEGSKAVAEAARVSSSIDGVREATQRAGEEGSDHLSLLETALGELSSLVSSTAAELHSLGQDIASGIGEGVQASETKIHEVTGAVGEHLKGVAEKTAATSAAWYLWGAEGVAAVTMVFNALAVLTLGYKALSFSIGLVTGESYKSANIDALIAENKEVQELQQSLHLTAVEAGAMADALRRLGVDKADIAAVADTFRSIADNGDELDRLGVKYQSLNGELLEHRTIVQNAKDVLDTYTEGWDRNQAAAAIGLGSYQQITNYLKLTQDELAKSKARLDEYNLGIGPESQAAVEAYQTAMREFANEEQLMSLGFKRAIADNIMPALTQLSIFFKDGWPFVVNVFRYGMAEITTLLYGLKMDVDLVVDVAKGGFGSLGDILIAAGKAAAQALTGDFSGAAATLAQGWADAKARVGRTGEEMATDAARNSAAMKLAWGFDDRTDPSAGAGKKGKKWEPPPEASEEVAGDDSGYAQQLKAAHDAYLNYEKALADKRAMIVKAANALELQQNQASYDQGLIDLQTYLTTKHSLTESALAAELTAKKDALALAQQAEKTAETAYLKDPTGDAARNVNESYAKVTAAQTAVIEAEAKLTQGRKQNATETTLANLNLSRSYQDLRAQMLEMQGQYVDAAQIRKQLDQESLERQQLIANAMTGDAAAEAAYWDQEALDLNKVNEARKKMAAEQASITIAQVSNQLALVDSAEKFYAITTSDAARQRIVLLQQELVAQRSVYDSIQGNEPAAIAARLQAQAAIVGVNEKLLEQQKILSDRTALGGANTALHEFANQATNIGAQIGNSMTGVFKGMEDALTNFVTKGKLDFHSLAESIISDLVRIAIQQSITGPLASGLGRILQNMMSPTATQGVPSSIQATPLPAFNPEFSFIPTMSAAGGVDIPAGINPIIQAHAKEMVLPAEQADVIRKLASGGGANDTPGVIVNIENNTGNQVSASSSAPKFDGKAWVVGVILENLDQNGALRPAIQGVMG